MNNNRLNTLLEKLHQGRLSEAETEELNRLYETVGYGNGQLLDESDGAVKEHIEARYLALLAAARRKRRFRIWKMATAAAAILTIVFFSKKMFYSEKINGSNLTTIAKSNIVPGHNGALLTLADGSVIPLDSANNGAIARQGSVQVVYGKGQLSYRGQGNGAQVAYNTLSTPKARQFQLVLPDGTKVWLNAASSIRYPVAFTGKERAVTVTGEAYFEVVHNSKMPFKVITANQVIEDIGTHFDVNAYANESAIKTTLLEGSVKVTRLGDKEEKLLQPGQQAQLTNRSINVARVNTEDAVAWKEGYFMFDNEPLETVMSKIARWYNVDIIFKDDALKKQNTYGTLSMFSDISKVLNLLEMTGVVKFEINGNTIIIDKR